MFQDHTQPRRALVIGLNYRHCAIGTLRGCINDTLTVQDLLRENNFGDDDITVHTDGDGDWGTHKDIMGAVQDLVDFAVANPSALLWFSFSGHGGQTQKNYSNTGEADYKDEGLIPTDFYASGHVTDNQLYETLVSKLPSTSKLFGLIDACHSGSMLDLPLTYRAGAGKLEGTESPDLAEVCMLSGCMDSQYSADAYFAGSFEGALTFSFAKAMHEAKELTYNLNAQQLAPMLVSYMRANNFDQRPTLSFTRASTLQAPMFANRPDFSPNVYIEMKGDQWAQFETTFSVYDDDEDRALLKDEAFQITNEVIKLYLQLRDGHYSLRLKDEQGPDVEGDGGVQTGRICYMNEEGVRGTIKRFDLSQWDSGFKTIHFTVDSSKDVDVSPTEVEVEVRLQCDYWCDELCWNIEDCRGVNVFASDKTFLHPFEKQACKHKLPSGQYTLKIKCSYGDGGVDGMVRCGEVETVVSWKGLDWKRNNGYLKYVHFDA